MYLAASDGAPADVTITIGTVPAGADKAAGDFTAYGDTALLSIAGVGRYWMARGREIIVEPAPGASDRNLRLYLLGSAFGAILHQRGILPLHANAVEIGGNAVAFSGHSGAGKSTLAAWFHDRGYRVISDDVCAITMNASGLPVVQGGLPRLRLWRDALNASGRAVEGFDQSYDGADKYDVPTRSGSTAGGVALAAVYLLGRGEGSFSEQGVQRLRGIEAIDALVANTYRGAFAREMDQARQNLEACLAVMRSVPIFKADRTWGFEAFELQARALERHALSVCRRAQR